MTIRKLAWPLACFVAGLGIGVLWSPFSGARQISVANQNMPRSGTISDAQFNKHIAKVRQQLGKEVAAFEEQFKDMSVRINEYPFWASAAPDGRFDIRDFKSGEIIASDLFSAEKGSEINELVRHYSFSCDKRTYSCDFGRGIIDSKITSVLFRVTDAKGNELIYLDSDGDGRWDRLTDDTQTPAQTYLRRGLCWDSINKDLQEK